MRRVAVTVAVWILASLGLGGDLGANGAVDGSTADMMISPPTVVLAKVSQVTVHTNIPLSTVIPASVTLDGVAASGVWADTLGHLAARFEVAGLGLAPGVRTVVFAGLFVDGREFSMTAEVRVR